MAVKKESAANDNDSGKWIIDTVKIWNLKGDYLRDTIIRYYANEDSAKAY
jgi:hypothetical protein